MQITTAARTATEADPPRLLLVEDNPADARLVRELLQQYRGATISIDHVTRLDRARARLDEQRYEVVLLDLSLPDSAGLDSICRLVRHQGVGSLVVLTGRDDADLRNRGMAIGASDWMEKDRLDAARLMRAIEQAVEGPRLRRALASALEQLEAPSHRTIRMRGAAQRLASRASAIDAALRRVAVSLEAAADATRKSLSLVELDGPPPRETLQQILERVATTIGTTEHRVAAIGELARALVRETNTVMHSPVSERYRVSDTIRRAVQDASTRVDGRIQIRTTLGGTPRDLVHDDGPLLQRIVSDLAVATASLANEVQAPEIRIEFGARGRGQGLLVEARVRCGSAVWPGRARALAAVNCPSPDDYPLLAETRLLVGWLQGRMTARLASGYDLIVEVSLP